MGMTAGVFSSKFNKITWSNVFLREWIIFWMGMRAAWFLENGHFSDKIWAWEQFMDQNTFKYRMWGGAGGWWGERSEPIKAGRNQVYLKAAADDKNIYNESSSQNTWMIKYFKIWHGHLAIISVGGGWGGEKPHTLQYFSYFFNNWHSIANINFTNFELK